ncbi:MAG: tetratricopeptide repeat protein, partial [Acidobacteria bacterium]|nr:tetratricopeptide repeat protein [Acidobacteriota bacterium]
MACAAMLVFSARPAAAQSTKDMILETQRQLAGVQEELRQRDRESAERFAALEALIKQNMESTTRLNQAIAVIERAVNKQSDAILPPVTRTAAKADALSDQFGGLRDAVEETNAMLLKLTTEVADIKTQLTTLPPPSMGAPGEGGGDPGLGDNFLSNAVGDFNRGSYDLAKAQFEDFLKFSPQSPQAAEAQYYLAQIAYNQNDYDTAIRQFDVVIQRYPGSFFGPEAQFKKAAALERLGRTMEAQRELDSLIGRYPNAPVTENARGLLQQLQAGGSGAA